MARFIITGEYKDKATKDARKDLKGLSKDTSTFGKLSKKYWGIASAAATFYAQKVLRQSIKNAMDDERSQRILALTLKNVASATDAAVISAEAQISKLQMMYGVTDDQLRPALSRLARSTGNTSAALYDLQLALDISAATGKSLEAVTNALGKAEDGNVASLQRLGLGLDASLLKTKDTKKIFDKLRETFKGFARQEAATTEGKFRRIGVAADEAKEAIGVGLIDAIDTLIGKKGDVDAVGKSLSDTADYVADLIAGTAILADKTSTSAFTDLLRNISKYTDIANIGQKRNTGAQDLKKILDFVRGVSKEKKVQAALQASITKQVISARNAEAAALAATKKTDDQKDTTGKKTLEQIMAEEAARKAGFKITEDIDSIQTVAAAKRLAEAREYKAEVLEAAQAQFDAVKNNYDLLSAVWETQLTAFDAFLAALKTKAAQAQIAVTYQGTGAGSAPSATNPVSAIVPEPAVPQFLGGGGSFGTNQLALGGQTINIAVNAGAIGSEDYLVGVIGDALTKYTRYGNTTAPAGFI